MKGSRKNVISAVEKVESEEVCRGGVCANTAVSSRDDSRSARGGTNSGTLPGLKWQLQVVCWENRRHPQLILG